VKTRTPAPALGSVAPDTPADVARTIDRMLAREPCDRHPTMQAVLDDLARWPRQLQAVATPAAAATDPPVPRSARRITRVRGGLVILGLAAAIGIGFAIHGRTDDEAPSTRSTPVRQPQPGQQPAPTPAVAPEPVSAVVPDPQPPPSPTAPAPIAPKPIKRAPPRSKRPAPTLDPNPIKRDDGVIVDPYSK
jgi:hypothetical protein